MKSAIFFDLILLVSCTFPDVPMLGQPLSDAAEIIRISTKR